MLSADKVILRGREGKQAVSTLLQSLVICNTLTQLFPTSPIILSAPVEFCVVEDGVRFLSMVLRPHDNRFVRCPSEDEQPNDVALDCPSSGT